MLFWEIKPDFLLKIAVRVGEITENLKGNRKFGLEEMVCFRLAILVLVKYYLVACKMARVS